MNREQAIELLGVSATFSAADIRKRYQELYSDYQIRLTNAPTLDLKRTYQRSILDLQEACELLAPNSANGAGENLPSPVPVASETARPSPSSGRPREPYVKHARASAAGMRPSTIALSGVAIVLVAVSAFLLLQYRRMAVLLESQQVSPKSQISTAPNGHLPAIQKDQQLPRDPGAPVLFKGGEKDCTLYVDGNKVMVLPSLALTSTSLQAGEHYLECIVSQARVIYRWNTTINLSRSGQKVVEIGSFQLHWEDILKAAMAGLVVVNTDATHGHKYKTSDCHGPPEEVQFSLTEVKVAGTQSNLCGEVPIRWNGSQIFVPLSRLNFIDEGGNYLNYLHVTK